MAVKKNKGIELVDVLIYAGAAFIIYSAFGKSKMSRDKAIQIILQYKPDANIDVLKSGDEGYVIARAIAFQKGLPIYTFNGKQYFTASGKAV